jgi:hypothetical protein
VNLWITTSGKGALRRVVIFDMAAREPGVSIPEPCASYEYAQSLRIPDEVLVGAALDSFLGDYKWEIRKGDVPNLWMVW